MRVLILISLLTFFSFASFAAATERCDIRYSVRLISPGHSVDTGSEVRNFSTCVSSLTECHTSAEELAQEHARKTPSRLGSKSDPDTVRVMHIESDNDCDESNLLPSVSIP